MSSLRSIYRNQRAARLRSQAQYLYNLPEVNFSENSSSSFSEIDNVEIMSFSSDRESCVSSLHDQLYIEPQWTQYCEILFDALITQVGLTLSASEKVLFLFRSLHERFVQNPRRFPSLRHNWMKKAKFTIVHVYIICNNNHPHGPFIGEPQNYGFFNCDQNLFPAVMAPGKYFLHIPFKSQIKSIFPSIADDCWITEESRPDVSNSALANRIKQPDLPLNRKKFTLTLHADEVAAGKSSSERIFPVFLTINEMKPEMRKKFFFMVGLFVGKIKPKVESFLDPICSELLEISSNPIELNSNLFATFHLIGLIADAPMRAYLRNVKQFNHLNGCDWCLVQASTVQGARMFPNITQEQVENLRRKKEDFIQFSNILEENNIPITQLYESYPRFRGLNGISPLLRVPDFDIVNGTLVEPMHCMTLGVFRNLMMKAFVNGNPSSLLENLINKQILLKELSSRLLAIKVPTELTRIPRGLDQLKFWKSCEWDSFLNYFFFATTKGLIKSPIIKHFMVLSRVYYLAHIGNSTRTNCSEIKNLVQEFQSGCEKYFGPSYLSYNLHILTHLSDSLENLGPNSNMSSYPLEDYMGIVKEKVHRYIHIGPSLVRFFMSDFRYKEYKATHLKEWNLTQTEKKYFGCSSDKDKVLSINERNLNLDRKTETLEILSLSIHHIEVSLSNVKFYKSVKCNGKRFSCDSYCQMKKRDDSKIKGKDGNYYQIDVICEHSDKFYFICTKFIVKSITIEFTGSTGFFSFPIENIHTVEKSLRSDNCVSMDEVLSKVIYVKSSNFHPRYKDHIIDQFLWNK